MKNSTKKALAIAGLVIVLILLFLFMRKNPAIVQAAENALSPIAPSLFTVEAGTPYTSRDFPLPPLLSNSFYLNTGCNFCSKISSGIQPASPPITQLAIAQPYNIGIAPFGGAG